MYRWKKQSSHNMHSVRKRSELSLMMEKLKNQWWIKKINYYCQNSHLHGLKYIIESSQINIFIRIIWAITFVLSASVMTVTFRLLINNYQENSVSFLTETTYLDWNTTFPAVTICQISGIDLALIENLLDERDNRATVEFFVTDLSFFSGSCYSCNSQCFTCPRLKINETVNKLRKPCSEILTNCMWNALPFNCCEQFLPLETEYGVCYSINSLHTSVNGSIKEKLNLKMNRKSEGIGELSVNAIEDIRVYFHAPEDVPFINSEANYRKDILLGEAFDIIFNVVEIENDAGIVELPIGKRECRFPWEIPDNLKVHKLYSYSTCMVQCHAENHLRLCNCTHHLMPYYNKRGFCDISGLNCLTDHFETVNRLHAKGSDKPGLTCDCLPSCIEPEYNVISSEKIYSRSAGGVTIKMPSLPTTRFKRVVVKSYLDLVVSIGGAAGLFIGASILTIIELFYLLFTRT